MNQPNQQSVVDDHRNMLQISKNVSKFQEDNMKSWVFIFFENVEKVEVSWNFFRKNKSQDLYAGKVTYDIYFQKGFEVDLDKARRGLDILEACTKFLFWKETLVTIKKNGKKWNINLPKEEPTSVLQKVNP